ncbi:uncharacterized protein RHOBADRAFT_53023 [Rhodotorula graminis WP1]|uniref:Transmembrane protein n=1 Tax=Rhodotorula graminis (strain WP1) TaxID=578459 RepID=A0A194S5M0_RHOGW|nr:uncharacterized protein RHOBADRAFT_53023 [Rhodotorula graminis WP1]KPV76023.1 hypothetical protein RHOBADRAFT_53023 [Rhodotorula graminis WP1]
MRARRRLALLPLVPRLLIISLLVSASATARTTSFDDSDALLHYSPTPAWTEVSAQGWAGGAARETNSSGAFVDFAFLGEQVSLYGAASAAFVVELDGIVASAAVHRPSTRLDTPVRLFVASNLDPATAHRVVLQATGDGLVRLDRVAISFSERTDQVPQLVASSAAASSSSTVSNSAPPSTSSAPAAPTSTKSMLETASSSTSPGAIAGAVIGTILVVTVIVFLFVLFLRRRRAAQAADEHERSSRHDFNAETGRRQSRASSLFAALGGGRSGRPRSSPIPLSAPGQAAPSRDASAPRVVGGGAECSPHPYGFNRPPSSTVLADPTLSLPTRALGDPPHALASRTWAQRLARASSWRRKASRLPETQRFYGVSPSAARVGGAGLPPGPPPARPLPSVPPREMRERWREGEPRLVQGSGRWESPRASDEVGHGPPPAPVVRQVFGTAVCDVDAPVVASSATHPIAAAHLRKRSVPRASSSSELPRPPHFSRSPRHPATAAPLSPTSFHNPFGSTSTAATLMHPSTVPPPHLPHRPHASLDSTSANSAHWTSSSARASVDIAGARIAHARPVVAMQELPRARAADGDLVVDEDNVPLYDPCGAVPLRVGSLRELRETSRADPLGTSSSSGAKGESLARRPTLTLRERDGDGAPEQAAVAAGYETQRAGPEHERARHRSAAALVEVVEELQLKDEDSPAFFSRRERIPRYSVDQGDPRAVGKCSR